VVVGADGIRSMVAREVGAKLAQDRGPHGATYYAYYDSAVWPAIEFFVADQGMAGIFPTHQGEACVFVCVPGDKAIKADHQPVGSRAAGAGGRAESRVAGFDALVETISPALASRLRTARRTSLVRGAVGLPNQVRQAHGPGWALVGDALYHRDPITGHGLSDAYRDAELLANALDDHLHGDRPPGWSLADYERRAAEARQEIFDLTCALGSFPPVDEFVALQRQLSDAIEAEALGLAARPIPGPRRLAVA
jgi:flavin-dependent dehydrogenase